MNGIAWCIGRTSRDESRLFSSRAWMAAKAFEIEVAVAEHDALGAARGAGGVDDDRQLVRLGSARLDLGARCDGRLCNEGVESHRGRDRRVRVCGAEEDDVLDTADAAGELRQHFGRREEEAAAGALHLLVDLALT